MLACHGRKRILNTTHIKQTGISLSLICKTFLYDLKRQAEKNQFITLEKKSVCFNQLFDLDKGHEGQCHTLV